MSSRRNESFRTQTLLLVDALLALSAFMLSESARIEVRQWLGMGAGPDLLFGEGMRWAWWIAMPFTPLFLERFGFYQRLRQKHTGRAIAELIKGLLGVALLLLVFAFFTKQVDAARLIVGLGIAFTFFFLLIRDRVVCYYLRHRSRDEGHKEPLIVAGCAAEMDELIAGLGSEITYGWRIVERFDLGQREVSELFDLLKEEAVARVLFVAKDVPFEKVARAVEACELQGVEAWLSASFIRTQIARPVFDAVGDRPMLVLRSTPELSWELLCKSLFDRSAAALMILVSLPLWLIAIIGIRWKSPGAPVFFSQMRAGRYGQPFKMWKFRTMVANAEELLEQIKAEHGNQMDGPVFKLDHDPRIFPFGALLRKLSIDELPQLLNVVKGDMSLVGPRPLPLYEVAAFSELAHRRRLSVKPGITCEWQAGGRNSITSFDEWVEMDLRYIDNWSLWLDFRILLRTIPAVLFSKGAK